MMLIVRIQLGDNDAMVQDQEGEVKRLLAKIVAEYTKLEHGYYHTIHDSNGNDCGDVGLME